MTDNAHMGLKKQKVRKINDDRKIIPIGQLIHGHLFQLKIETHHPSHQIGYGDQQQVDK